MWSSPSFDDEKNTLCRRKSLLWSLTLPLLPLGLAYSGATSWMFAFDGGLVSALYVSTVYRWYRHSFEGEDGYNKKGKQSFLCNLIYLPIILTLMTIHCKRWKYEKGQFWSTHLAWVQDWGMRLCPVDNTHMGTSQLPSEVINCTSPFYDTTKASSSPTPLKITDGEDS